MITRIVVDTNVVMKWIPGKDESEVDTARKIYSVIKTNGIEMWAPEYMLVECLQIFLRKRQLKPEVAMDGLSQIEGCGLGFVPLGAEDFEDISDISFKFGQSVYDAIFLHAAKQKECQLVTFDEKVYQRCDWAVSPKEFLKSEVVE